MADDLIDIEWIRENSYVLAMAAIGAFDMTGEGGIHRNLVWSIENAGDAIVAMVEGESSPLEAVRKVLGDVLRDFDHHWLSHDEARGDGAIKATPVELISSTVKETLDVELRDRFWKLYDAANAMLEGDEATVEAWGDLNVAVAAIPESCRYIIDPPVAEISPPQNPTSFRISPVDDRDIEQLVEGRWELHCCTSTSEEALRFLWNF